MKKQMFSILLALALLCAWAPRAQAGTDVDYVPADGVEIGKTYVLVADGQYALTSRQEGPTLHSYADDAETTLASAPVTVSDGVLIGEITGDMLWTVCQSTAPAAYDGMEQYFLRDSNGNYLRRGSGSGGDGAQLLAEPELYTEKLRFNTWSFYPHGDGTFAVYANSERAYGRDYPYYLYATETSFDSPSSTTRTESDPFAFADYDDCARIQLFEAVGYEPCEHVYEETVVPPACASQGYTLHTCAKCGSSYQSDFVDALGHDWPAEGEITTEPTETERGVLTFTCTRCGETKDRPLAAGTEKAHKNEILFISDVHSGKNAENGYHNLRAMFRLLRENDDFIPEVVSGGGDYLESRTYDDVDWPHCIEAMQQIMYETSPDTVQVLAAGNHEWEWSLMSDEMIEKLFGSPRVGLCYTSDDFEIFHIGAHTNDSPKEEFLDGDIAQLRSYLASVAGSGKVIFIQTHWPLHYGYNSSDWRTTKNADVMIDLLNEYAESLDICFVWGHNHNEDETRHKCMVSGDEMEYAKNETKQIRFTYVNAGCLNERHAAEGGVPENDYYGPGYLLEARITGDKLILDYGHITGAWPDPDEAVYDHNADLLYVENIQEARESHHEIPLLHRGSCEHEYTAAVTPPTCTEAGFTTYTCAKCGSSYTGDEVDALGHDYQKAVTEPTCTEAGFTTYTCTRCGDSYVGDEVDALGHDYQKTVTEPTCTEAGFTTYTCTKCGSSYTGDEVDALGHDYQKAVTEPTCTEAGFTTYTCTRCSDSYVGDEVDALGHDWDKGEVTLEPTQTEPGVRTFTCTRCGGTRTESIPPLSHEHDYKALVTAPTCTEAGYTTWTCSCGDSYVGDEVAALGHDFGEWTTTKEPTCTADGEQSRACARCDVKETRKVDALKHDFQGGVCTRCGEADPDYVPPVDKTELEKAVKAAEAMEAADYTPESYAALQEAVGAARALPADADQAAVDAAAAAVNKAIEDLEPAPDKADKRELAKAIGAAEAVDPEKYTDETVEAMYKALEAAKAVNDRDDAAQIDVDKAAEDLQAAIDALEEKQLPPAPFRFDDVQNEKAFYFRAVYWAYEASPQITNGMDRTHFGPDLGCTRGQVVTFLWRAAGCPAPAGAATAFTDVGPKAFYARAVAWAVEQGITKGMTDTTFCPDAACTRGQIVTFLWRFRGTPAPAGADTGFTDVNAKAFYAKAVAWAVENKVTNGMTPTTFAPDAACTRGQIVTFLQRAAAT